MLPLLPKVSLPRLTGEMLAEVVHHNGTTAGSLDGWGWWEFKTLPVSWFDFLARIFSKVEYTGVWPEGLLDAEIALIPKTDGDATPSARGLLVFYRLFTVCGPLLVWSSLRTGSGLWFLILSSVLGVVEVRLMLCILLHLILKRCFLGLLTLMFIFLLLMLLSPFDKVDRGILDKVLSSLGLPGWFRHAYFEYHSHVRQRLKVAAGLVNVGLGMGEIPQECPFCMMFIVALYLPWCRFLGARDGVEPQLCADNLKCVSRDPAALLRAARFTVGYVRLVGQEPAPVCYS